MGACDAEVRALDTVRTLHETVVSLRKALEEKAFELQTLQNASALKDRRYSNYRGTIGQLSLENHALRQKILSISDGNLPGNFMLQPKKKLNSNLMNSLSAFDTSNQTSNDFRERSDENKLIEDPLKKVDSDIVDKTESEQEIPENESKDKEGSCSTPEPSIHSEKNMNDKKEMNLTDSAASAQRVIKTDSEESEEVDDIELIFTTDDTKELCTLQEDMVSINDTDQWPFKSTQSVFVETDISKCGVINESEMPNQMSRRNTVANAFSSYRPILQRETSMGNKTQLGAASHFVKFADCISSNVRPILAENNNPTQESEAQTDISALPSHWKSESYLAHHKISHNFTTLPSKFTLPPDSIPPRKQSLKLCEKTQEARRILLSDINFTSMVPELSQSFDHLCQVQEDLGISSLCKNYPRAFSYMKNTNYLMSPGYSNQSWAPFEYGRQTSWEQCQCSLTSISPCSPLDLAENRRRRHSFHPSALSLDSSWGNRQIWSSTPSSPTRCQSISLSASASHQPICGWIKSCPTSNYSLKRSKSHIKCRNKVALLKHKFGISLPDLREPDSGGESTESLIEESEDCLRRSIDAIVSGSEAPRSVLRRFSEPRFKVTSPQRSSHRPFIVKSSEELKPNQLVKVITFDGRVVKGRVKYVGPVSGSCEVWIGVQVETGISTGTDGTFNGNRYFECERNCAIFVPFRKLVLAWTM